jgi:hypothetical protein
MANQGSLLLKILALSAAISAFIKYVVPYFNLPATTAVALILVLVPPILLGLMLAWRGWQDKAQPNQKQSSRKQSSQN